MKKILGIILASTLIFSAASFGAVTTNPDITGIPTGGGLSEGSDVTFGSGIFNTTFDNATGNEVAVMINYTTNKATSGNDTGLEIKMTDIVSPGTSYGINYTVGGVSKFKVDNTGNVSGVKAITATGEIKGTKFTATNAAASLQGATTNSEITVQPRAFTSDSKTAVHMATGAFSNNSGTATAVAIEPTYDQVDSVAANTDLKINRTIGTGVGTGLQLLIDAQVDDVSKFSIDSVGNITTAGIINAAIKTYANLSNTADQTFAGTGTGYALLFNSNDNLVGITHSTSSNTENITIVTSGVYSINAQPQVTAGAAGDFHMWLQVNTGGGFADVANSNVKLSLPINNEGVIPLTLTIPLDAGDIVRLMGSVTHTSVILDATAPGGEPVIPAMICSIHRI